jgi:hypothetical protein
VQEAGLAKSALIICSKQSAKYSDIFLFYEVLKKDYTTFAVNALSSKISMCFKHLSTMRRAAEEITDDNLSMTVIRTLRQARYLQASDPRDRIFGILGLSPAFPFLLPTPDYNKTASDVFCEVARALISHPQSVQILTEVNAESTLAGHPSWAPDWSKPAILDIQDKTYGVYNAARDSNAEFDISSNGKELWVAGKAIDSVWEIVITAPGAYRNKSASSERIGSWQESCALGLSITEYPTGEPVREALWRTLCWNVDRVRHYPAPAENGAWFEEWHRF